MKQILRTLFTLTIALTGVLRAQEVIDIPEVADDPKARDAYEFNLLRNPATGTIPALIRPKELKFAASLPDKEALPPEADAIDSRRPPPISVATRSVQYRRPDTRPWHRYYGRKCHPRGRCQRFDVENVGRRLDMGQHDKSGKHSQFHMPGPGHPSRPGRHVVLRYG